VCAGVVAKDPPEETVHRRPGFCPSGEPGSAHREWLHGCFNELKCCENPKEIVEKSVPERLMKNVQLQGFRNPEK